MIRNFPCLFLFLLDFIDGFSAFFHADAEDDCAYCGDSHGVDDGAHAVAGLRQFAVAFLPLVPVAVRAGCGDGIAVDGDLSVFAVTVSPD